MLLAVTLCGHGCSKETFGGQTIGEIELGTSKTGSTTVNLPPGATMTLYEDYALGFGGKGRVYNPDSCYRLVVQATQGKKTTTKTCFPFGGSNNKHVRSTKCFSRDKYANKGSVCRVNHCKLTLPTGGATKVAVARKKLKDCGRRVTVHKLYVKHIKD
jgi:hypothetical protein